MDMDLLEMCEDEQMKCLRSTLLRSGKGRRPDLPHIEVKNKLFLQLYNLRFEGQRTITEVEGWFLKICPHVNFPAKKVWKLILRIVKASRGKTGAGLQAFVNEIVDLNFISESLQSIGVTRALDSNFFVRCHITNDIVVDLGNFFIAEGYTFSELKNTLNVISLTHMDCSVESLRARFLAAVKQKTKHVKNVGRNPDALRSWLNTPFFGDKHSADVPPSPRSSLPQLPPPFSTADWPPISSNQPSTLPASSIKELSYPACSQPSASSKSSPPLAMPKTSVLPVSLVEPSASSKLVTSQPTVLPVSPEPTASSKPFTSKSTLPPACSQPSASSKSSPPLAMPKTSVLPVSLVEPSASSKLVTSQPTVLPVSPEPTASSKPFTSKSTLPPACSQPSASSKSSPPLAMPKTAVLPVSSQPPVLPVSPEPSASSKPVTSRPATLPVQTSASKIAMTAITTGCNKKFVPLEGLRCLKTDNISLKCKNAELSDEVKHLKRSYTYKRNFLLKKKNAELNNILKDLKSENDALTEEIKSLKQIKLSLQKNLSKSKKRIEEFKEKSESLTYYLNMINSMEENENKLQLRDSRYNKFKDSVRITCMALQGKGISASKCSEVIQVVARHLFGQSLSLKELPSNSSTLTMMCEGNHIAKVQVIEEVNSTNNFTFCSDGTSRQKMHYMERHLVLNSGKTLSMGFSTIASDDANSMLEQIIQLFKDFVDVYGHDLNDQEKNDLLKDIVKKMNCLMSDRAANMKLLNRKLDEWRKQFLNDEDVKTHFLYCNAHFLLGLSSATEKAISENEKEMINGGLLLGRDKQQKFKHFSSSKESAAFRSIRTSAEVLGPRGDEKSGVRQEWLNYCDELGILSKFSSYRSNRFNNVFDNATALLYHRHHILDFLTNEASSENLKLQSVMADLEDVNVISLIGAISLFNLTITTPYWKLMNSSLPYGSFSPYVKKIKATFDEFLSMNSYDECIMVPVFVNFPSSDVHTIPFINDHCSVDIVFSAFTNIVKECQKILDRQLVDFLDGGVYGGPLEAHVKAVLDTCPLTNLIGERLFGSLDYCMHKRKRASLHLRSTLNMWSHNKTIDWFCNLTTEKQAEILENARTNANKLRLQSKEYETQVNNNIKHKMSENKRRRSEKDIQSWQKKSRILECIISDGGICKNKFELDRLLKRCGAEGLRTQIRYRKEFFKENLKVTGTISELYDRLLQQVEEEAADLLPSVSDKRSKV